MSTRWRELLTKQSPDLSACVDWNIEAARTGILPNPVLAEESTAKHEFGPLYRVGAVDGCQGKMRIIREYWDPNLDQNDFQALWALPEDPTAEVRHIAARSTMYHPCHNEEIRDNRPIPMIRYALETRKNCQAASHPNNKHQSNGAWRRSDSNTSAAGSNCWTFECDITKAKAGEYCVGVGKGIKDNGVMDERRYYVWVAKIKSIDVDKKTLRVVELQPTKNPWEKGNIAKCKWLATGRPEEETPNKSVISYFKKLKRDACLGAAQLKLVDDHAMWNVTAAAGGDSGSSGDDENGKSSDGEDGELDKSSDSECNHDPLRT